MNTTETTETTVTVRYFAAARAAAGVAGEQVGGVHTVGELRRRLVELHGSDLESVLTRCSFLVDELVTTDDDAPLTSASQVDILPPFAGG